MQQAGPREPAREENAADEHAALAQEAVGLGALALVALVVGVVAALIGVSFRFALEWAETMRTVLLARSQSGGLVGLALAMLGTAAAAASAAALVRRFSPHAAGSGIPQVEAEVRGEAPAPPLRLIAVKFGGGLLAIGSGLALGREGPIVQMGAAIARAVADAIRMSAADGRTLLVAGAGAGLAVAFSAPVAGAIFVLEELVRRFETRTAVAALGASTSAVGVSGAIFGSGPEFTVAATGYTGIGAVPLYIALGVAAGVVGVVYLRAIVGALGLADRVSGAHVELRAAAIGAAVGALGWWAPAWVGGGDAIVQQTLAVAPGLGALLVLFAVRFAMGAVSYAAGTPGGLFAPMLVIGAQLGALFAGGAALVLPALPDNDASFAVVGMAALFTAVVRAPLTGITLVVEMTGAVNLLLPMLAACFAAMAVATALRAPPIYDLLRARVAGRTDRDGG
jgi:CIC family chloride channel protein